MSKENIKKLIDIDKMDVHAREVLGAVVGLAKTCGNNPYTDDTIKLMCDILLRLYSNYLDYPGSDIAKKILHTKFSANNNYFKKKIK